jgi:predicted flavoprotein YhiN
MPSAICSNLTPDVAVIGGGPAGLMAAEVLSQAGLSVHVFDAMASVGRKFLLAGIGGLNLTHGEDLADFKVRYGQHQGAVEPWMRAMGPAEGARLGSGSGD